jgi:AraC-like DNA-binding protein
MSNNLQKTISIRINIGEMIFNIYVDRGFFQAETPPGILGYNHMHNHSSFEVQLIFKGSGVLRVGGENITFNGRSAFLIFPGVYHVLEFDPGIAIKRRSFSFSYEPSRLRQLSSTKHEMNEIQGLLTNEKKRYYHVKDFPCSVDDYLEDANSEFMEHRLFYHVSLQAIFSCAVIKLFRAFEGGDEEKYSINEDEYDAMRIFTIEKFFDERHFEDVKAEDLADLLGITVRHLNRVMKKFFDVSFREKLTKTRVEVAKDLLKNTDMNIFDISWKVGYASTVGFSSAFKRHTNMTPGVYRKKFTKNVKGRGELA